MSAPLSSQLDTNIRHGPLHLDLRPPLSENGCQRLGRSGASLDEWCDDSRSHFVRLNLAREHAGRGDGCRAVTDSVNLDSKLAGNG